MSKKLDRAEFELLAHTEAMVQMISNKLVVNDYTNFKSTPAVQEVIETLEPVMTYLQSNAQGMYYCYVGQGFGGQVTMYFEHSMDRANVIELIKTLD
jgi:hypothetical protein